MATRNVSNFVQLVDALNSCQSGDIIEILADLDFNDVIMDITLPIQFPSSSDTLQDVTINGNNHVIYNLDTSLATGTVTTIFQVRNNSTTITINNLSYLNCHLSGSGGTYIWYFGTGSIEGRRFNGGVVQGTFAKSPFGGRCEVYNMMFTYSYSKGSLGFSGSNASSPSWNFCWFKLIGCTYKYNSSSPFMNKFYNSYIEGDLTIETTTLNPAIFTRVNNSVINISTFIDSPQADTFCGGEDSNTPNALNITKITSSTPMVDSVTGRNILVTDDQMKNAEYLASVGFDIIA